MPGIVAIISHRPPEECRLLVDTMVRALKHENFYRSGTYSAPELGCYGGWVAHEERSAAEQILDERRDIAVMLSGELFCDPQAQTKLSEHRRKLENYSADRVIHLYDKKGEDYIGELNGSFSGFLVDRRRRKALLFNDRYGLERGYWFESNDAIVFSSEAKALLSIVPEVRALDEEGVAHLLAYGCTLDWRTLYRGVRLLEGGSLWSFQNGELRKGRYFKPEDWESQPPLTAEAFDATFQETFRRVLPRYIGHCDRLGISLTGGLDSRMIMACLPVRDGRQVCYTFSGLNHDTLDNQLAGRVAATCGLEHHTLRIRTGFLADYARYVDRTVYATDGCSGAVGAHEIHLNEQARQLARVRLTGNFGSEVLRSVSTFKPLGLSSELFSDDLRRRVAQCVADRKQRREHPVTFSAFREVPWNLFGTLAAARSQITFRTPYLDNEIVALAFRAPQPVRESAASSVKLIEKNRPDLMAIPTDSGLLGRRGRLISAMRHLLAQVTFKLDYLDQDGLPSAIPYGDGAVHRLANLSTRHRYLPYRHWFRHELSTYVIDVLTDARVSRQPYWNARFLPQMVRDHIAGRRNYVREINAVLTLEATERLMVNGFSS
jgi:asparagine synthase (glutamine-hydrolysing)